MKDKINFNNFNQLIFYLIPITLILSNFLTNAIVIYLSIYGIYQILFNKDNEIFNNKLVKIFIFFCIFISINSLILNSNFLSLKSSFSFIRYLFFIVAIYYLYKKNHNLILNFYIIYLFILVFLFFDANYQIINEGINIFGFNSYHIQQIEFHISLKINIGFLCSKFNINYLFFYCFHKNLNYLILICLIIIEICFISGERAATFSMILFFLYS